MQRWLNSHSVLSLYPHNNVTSIQKKTMAMGRIHVVIGISTPVLSPFFLHSWHQIGLRWYRMTHLQHTFPGADEDFGEGKGREGSRQWIRKADLEVNPLGHFVSILMQVRQVVLRWLHWMYTHYLHMCIRIPVYNCSQGITQNMRVWPSDIHVCQIPRIKELFKKV